MSEIQISINNLSKIYANGFKALDKVSLKVKQGEILAMLGPNGAGKTSLISIICGIVKPSSGTVIIDNFDIIKNYRETRSRIGLVPQELNLESFETVFDTVSYSRGLYGKPPKPEHIEKYPELHELVWKVGKLGSHVKQNVDLEMAKEFKSAIQDVEKIFWETKK